MLARVRTVSEAFLTETTRIILLLEVYYVQVWLADAFAFQNGAAQTTHPLALFHEREAVFNGQCLRDSLKQSVTTPL